MNALLLLLFSSFIVPLKSLQLSPLCPSCLRPKGRKGDLYVMREVPRRAKSVMKDKGLLPHLNTIIMAKKEDRDGNQPGRDDCHDYDFERNPNLLHIRSRLLFFLSILILLPVFFFFFCFSSFLVFYLYQLKERIVNWNKMNCLSKWHKVLLFMRIMN